MNVVVAPYAEGLDAWIILYFAIIARLSFVVFFMPGIGEQVVPLRIRLMALLTLSAMFSTSGYVALLPAAPLSSLTGLLLGEVAIGFFLGVTLRLSIWMLSIAGSVIAQSIGLAQLLGVAVENEAQTLPANLLSMAGVAVLLSANFHIHAISGFFELYSDLPPGSLASMNQFVLIERVFAAFGFALLLAWPFIALNLLYNVCLGFINKALPQLMVAFVGAPFMVGGGILLLAISVAGLLTVWQERVLSVIGWL